MPGPGEQRPGVGLLDDLALAQHHHAVREMSDHAHVVGDDHDAGAGAVADPPQQRQDLGLHGHVERGGGLVGEQQLGLVRERQREHDPLLLASGELVRVAAEPLLGVGDLDRAEQLDRPHPGRPAPRAPMRAQGLGQLPADGSHRVEGGLRLLEDHRDPAAAIAEDLLLGKTEHLLAAQPHRAGRDGTVGQQADHRAGGHRLAGAGLADEGDDLTLVDGHADRPDRRPGMGEGDGEVADLEHGMGHGYLHVRIGGPRPAPGTRAAGRGPAPRRARGVRRRRTARRTCCGRRRGSGSRATGAAGGRRGRGSSSRPR